MITIHHNWEGVFDHPIRTQVEALLPAFLMSSRWFGGKAKTIRSTVFSDVLRMDMEEGPIMLGFVEVAFREGGVETYTIPISAAFGAEADRLAHDCPYAIIGGLHVTHSHGHEAGVLYDALWNADCAFSLLRSIGRRAQYQGASGTLVGTPTALFDEQAVRPDTASIAVMKAEQSNTSVRFGDRIIMKLYRRVEPGINPDLEIGRTLTARNFRHSPALVGALEYMHERDMPTTVAIAQTFIANQGNAWEYTLAQLGRYFDSISLLARESVSSKPPAAETPNRPSTTPDLLVGFVDSASLLGRRTGELHMVLGQPSHDPAFAPEACSAPYVQSRIQTMQLSATRALALLRSRLSLLSEPDREQATKVLEQEAGIMDRLETLKRIPLTTMRIRCHGDYHLGQVLYTGEDFVIIDYEGEPARPLEERRAKHLPVVDLAGMIRSFHYAAHAALRQRDHHQSIEQSTPSLLPWTEQWYRSACTAFLKGYRAIAGNAPFASQSQQEFDLLLDVHVLDKAVYELTYELNNRPDWVSLPLSGILQCTQASSVGGDGTLRTEGGEVACAPNMSGQTRDEVNQ
jgi:maltose alpha-D-glucosyltransferase/alpha-amylase